MWSSTGLNFGPLNVLTVRKRYARLPYNCMPIACLYADDTELFSSSYDFTERIGNLNSDLINIRNWLAKNKLQHHPTKSKLLFIGSL